MNTNYIFDYYLLGMMAVDGGMNFTSFIFDSGTPCIAMSGKAYM